MSTHSTERVKGGRPLPTGSGATSDIDDDDDDADIDATLKGRESMALRTRVPVGVTRAPTSVHTMVMITHLEMMLLGACCCTSRTARRASIASSVRHLWFLR